MFNFDHRLRRLDGWTTRAKKRKARAGIARETRKLRLETLEDRVVPAFTLAGNLITLGFGDDGTLRNGSTMIQFNGVEYAFPGTPYHEIALSAGGTLYRNYTDAGLEEISGNSTNTSGGGILSAQFVGSAGGSA